MTISSLAEIYGVKDLSEAHGLKQDLSDARFLDDDDLLKEEGNEMKMEA